MAIVHSASMDMCVQKFVCVSVLILSDTCLGPEFVDHMDILLIIFSGAARVLSLELHHLTFPPAMYKYPSFSRSL